MFATARHASALAIAAAVLLGSSAPALASDRDSAMRLPQVDFTLATTLATSVPFVPGVTMALAPALVADTTVEPTAALLAEAVQTRPIDMVIPRGADGSAGTSLRRGMYVSFAALQVFDAMSTRKALAAGAREVNPLMTGVVKNNTVFLAVKAGSAVATTYFVERLAKNHPRRAMIVMAVLNTAYAVVVVNNYRVASAR